MSSPQDQFYGTRIPGILDSISISDEEIHHDAMALKIHLCQNTSNTLWCTIETHRRETWEETFYLLSRVFLI